MKVRSVDGRIPRIGEGSYVHSSADVFGDVAIGHGCVIHTATVRDYAVVGHRQPVAQ